MKYSSPSVRERGDGHWQVRFRYKDSGKWKTLSRNIDATSRRLEANDFQNGIDLEVNDSIYWEEPHGPHERSCAYLREVLGVPEE